MTPFHYEPAQDLDEPLLERLRRFPREPDMLSYGVRSFTAVLLRASLRMYHRLRIDGLENIPADRSCVMVANHSSHLDALCLLSAVPLRRLHQTFPAAAADYFFVNLPRIALAVLVVNALPFHRETHARQSLAVCRQLLAQPGNILIIFPEGTRSVSGQVGPFRPGIAMLVAGSGVPVVPCYLAGAHKAFPKGAWVPRPRPIRLTIGKPRTYESASHDKDSLRQICQDLREAVVELGGDKSRGSKVRADSFPV
jgi:1-acyl-sn-glycerol-3-phosphate acyltransferase